MMISSFFFLLLSFIHSFIDIHQKENKIKFINTSNSNQNKEFDSIEFKNKKKIFSTQKQKKQKANKQTNQNFLNSVMSIIIILYYQHHHEMKWNGILNR